MVFDYVTLSSLANGSDRDLQECKTRFEQRETATTSGFQGTTTLQHRVQPAVIVMQD
jgi:hypothetical protein